MFVCKAANTLARHRIAAVAVARSGSTAASVFTPNHPTFTRRAITKPLQITAFSSQVKTEGVTLTDTTHKLYFVADVTEIDKGVPNNDFTREVHALELKNNKGLSVKCMAEGANMVGLSIDGTDYIWDNIEGACYYGPKSNAFPLQRGLILHGGVRFAAICAEHGRYSLCFDLFQQTFSPTANASIFILQVCITTLPGR